MKFRTRYVTLLLGLTMLSVGSRAGAQAFTVTITVDEFGVGRFQNSAGFNTPLVGVLAPDPGPGGLALALTYDLLGPPGLVAGDLFLQELAGGPLSDVIRFNAPTAVTGSLVFYSDNADGADALADRGFPGAVYANFLNLVEVGPEGANGIVYTPAAGQPGFVAGAGGPVTYIIRSDTVPEPGTVVLTATGLVAIFGVARRRGRTTV